MSKSDVEKDELIARLRIRADYLRKVIHVLDDSLRGIGVGRPKLPDFVYEVL